MNDEIKKGDHSKKDERELLSQENISSIISWVGWILVLSIILCYKYFTSP